MRAAPSLSFCGLVLSFLWAGSLVNVQAGSLMNIFSSDSISRSVKFLEEDKISAQKSKSKKAPSKSKAKEEDTESVVKTKESIF